jgi:hypothetical protein
MREKQCNMPDNKFERTGQRRVWLFQSMTKQLHFTRIVSCILTAAGISSLGSVFHVCTTLYIWLRLCYCQFIELSSIRVDRLLCKSQANPLIYKSLTVSPTLHLGMIYRFHHISLSYKKVANNWHSPQWYLLRWRSSRKTSISPIKINPTIKINLTSLIL